MIKVSFLGDIMCEPLLLKAAKQGNTYDFSGVFENIKDLISESDYVIGNLETPLAGKEAKLVNELFLFNAPDEFGEAVKAAGIDFVSTANNHCMDRGIEGLKRTVRVLDSIGLSHNGTYETPDQEKHPFVAEVKDTRIAVIPFTYGTNYSLHHRLLPNEGYADLLHAETVSAYVKKKKSFARRIEAFLRKGLKKEQLAAIKKALGLNYNSPLTDNNLDENAVEPYFQKLKKTIDEAGKNADLVVFYPHVGGQFNVKPGRFTEYTFGKALEFGADAVIASHPHIVQKAEYKDHKPCFYSLGNFSMSPNSVYLLHENLPEYGLAVHLYVENKKIIKTTFSILKILEKKGTMLTVFPVDLLFDTLSSPEEKEKLLAEVGMIRSAVTGEQSDVGIIQHEYILS